ncbi:MAG: TolC family protein [Crocinitomicaceae bacterium]
MKQKLYYPKFISYLFVVFTMNFVHAQEVLSITLGEVLQQCGANNATIKTYEAKVLRAEAQLIKDKEWWLPGVFAGAQTHQLMGVAMNGNGNFFIDVNRNNLLLGLGINANIDIASGLFQKKVSAYKILSIARESIAARNHILLESVHAYYDLLRTQMELQVYDFLLTHSDTIINQMKIHQEAGLRYESDILMTRSNKSHLEINALNTRKELSKSSSKLVHLLRLNHDVLLISGDSTLVPLLDEIIEYSDTAFYGRAELWALKMDIKSMVWERKIHTTGLFIPDLNINANGGYFGRVNGQVSPMDPVSNPDPNQLYPTSIFQFSLGWSLPLGSLFYKGDRKKIDADIRVKEMEIDAFKDVAREEIRNAHTELRIGRLQMEIAKEAIDLSAKALRQATERQKLGIAKPFEIFQAQEFFVNAQLDYLKTVCDYNKAYFSLQVAEGSNIEIKNK